MHVVRVYVRVSSGEPQFADGRTDGRTIEFGKEEEEEEEPCFFRGTRAGIRRRRETSFRGSIRERVSD